MPMLVFIVGALLVIGAYFRVADLAQYISRTVVVAYLTGAAVPDVRASAARHARGGSRGGERGRSFCALIQSRSESALASPWHLAGLCRCIALTISAASSARPTWPALALALIFIDLVVSSCQRWGVHVATF